MNAGNGNMKGLVLAGDYDTTWARMQQQAQTLVKSGFLPKAVDTPEKALAVMMTGSELGLAPMASFRLIDVIQGLPTLKPMGMLALIRRSGQLAAMEVSDDGSACTVRMLRSDGSEHTERFGMDDADRMLTTEWQNGNKRTIKLSEKANWKQQPATMRKWRAISACCRVLFSDVIMGLYTSEEVAAFAGGEFDMGDYIDGESREVPADIADLAAEVGKDREVTVTQVAERSAVTGVAERTEAGNGDWFDEALRQMEAEGAERLADEAPQGAPQGAGEPPAEPLASAQQVKLMHVLMRKVLKNGAEEKFRTWLKDTYGTETTKELTVAQASAVIDVLKKKEAALAQTAQ